MPVVASRMRSMKLVIAIVRFGWELSFGILVVEFWKEGTYWLWWWFALGGQLLDWLLQWSNSCILQSLRHILLCGWILPTSCSIQLSSLACCCFLLRHLQLMFGAPLYFATDVSWWICAVTRVVPWCRKSWAGWNGSCEELTSNGFMVHGTQI